MLKPIGIPPHEISAMVNRAVVAQHADDVAFLWCQRERAVRDPRYTLADLAALDLRVSAHEDGLRVAGEVGWSECLDRVESQTRGACFALGVLAFGTGDRRRMRDALALAGTNRTGLSELASSLGWVESEQATTWIGLLLEAQASHHRRVGIAAAAIRRFDPGHALVAAISDPDADLRARALRACGELRRHDLADRVRAKLDDDVAECRHWAAWSLVLLGRDFDEALGVLWQFVEESHPLAPRALEAALRNLPDAQARKQVSSFARRGGSDRLVVVAAGIVGDPESVPWLIERMDVPELARLAGDAFAAITGVDLAYEDLVAEAPLSGADAPEEDPDPISRRYESALDWPSASLVGRWWGANKDAFVRGRRYLDGKPISVPGAIEVLMRGKQPRRAAAVLELARLVPEWKPLETRARGSLQAREMTRWTS